jgi:iron complex transport system ATP-binding protein
VLVSHHVEEIPPGFSHALVMADGIAVAAGPLADVVTTDVMSRAFDLPIEVDRREGRAWARMTTRERHTDGR